MRLTRKRIGPIVLLLFAMLLAACGGENAGNEPAAEAPVAQATEAPAEEPTDMPEPPANTPESEPTEMPAEPTSEPEPTATTEPTATPEPEPTEDPGVVQTFTIVAAESEARFSIDEVLFGDPKTVVGVTNEIAGNLTTNIKSPTETTIGEIQIDASNFVTDNNFRNGAIRRFILQSDQARYQFITFTPTELVNLPDAVVIGEPVTFQIVGDLKVRDITQPATFDATVTLTSETTMSGTASTEVLRSDYELVIPDVQGVADVTDEVQLIIEFTAVVE